MEVIAGFLVVMAIGWATVKAGEAAAASLANYYRQRRDRFAVEHPQSQMWVAGIAGAAAAVIHGTGPAWRAFKRDWAKHYALKRDEVRTRFADPAEPQPAPAAPAQPAPAPQPAPVPTPAPTAYPPLSVIAGGLAEKEPMAITEIRTIADVRKAVEDYVNRKRAELEDASAALNRARADAGYLLNLGEKGAAVLNKDPGTAAAVQSLIEAEQGRIQGEQARVTAAEGGLARAQTALAGLARHKAMEEAVAATPQASSDTKVYQPQ